MNFEIVSAENVSAIRSGGVLLATFIGGALFFFGPIIGAIVFVFFSVALSEFTRAIVDYLRKLLILKIDPGLVESIMPGETKDLKERAISQAQSFNEQYLKNILDLTLEAEGKSKYASIQQLPLELAIIEAMGE